MNSMHGLTPLAIEETILRGTVANNSDEAYENINVYADILNDDGDVIGEGIRLCG